MHHRAMCAGLRSLCLCNVPGGRKSLPYQRHRRSSVSCQECSAGGGRIHPTVEWRIVYQGVLNTDHGQRPLTSRPIGAGMFGFHCPVGLSTSGSGSRLQPDAPATIGCPIEPDFSPSLTQGPGKTRLLALPAMLTGRAQTARPSTSRENDFVGQNTCLAALYFNLSRATGLTLV
jgi:hypothetical protein